MSDCQFTPECVNPAVYVIRWDADFVGIDPTEACVYHTAQARANDPLEYIAAVRSLHRVEALGGWGA